MLSFQRTILGLALISSGCASHSATVAQVKACGPLPSWVTNAEHHLSQCLIKHADPQDCDREDNENLDIERFANHEGRLPGVDGDDLYYQVDIRERGSRDDAELVFLLTPRSGGMVIDDTYYSGDDDRTFCKVEE